MERICFALVAQRALEPGSKMAATRWVAGRVAIVVTLETSAGRVAKRSLTSTCQRQIFAALELPEPPAFSDFEVTATLAETAAGPGSL